MNQISIHDIPVALKIVDSYRPIWGPVVMFNGELSEGWSGCKCRGDVVVDRLRRVRLFGEQCRRKDKDSRSSLQVIILWLWYWSHSRFFSALVESHLLSVGMQYLGL